jgi:hypothetical protein
MRFSSDSISSFTVFGISCRNLLLTVRIRIDPTSPTPRLNEMLQVNDAQMFLILPGGKGLRKIQFQARKVVHESVNFVDQTALSLTNQHL